VKKNSISKIKMFSIVGSVIIIATLVSHFRAYFYSEESLKKIAQEALSNETSSLTQCEEVIFLRQSTSESYAEVVTFEWICLNKVNDEYLIAATIESDGFVDVSRIQLTKSEIKKLISLNSVG
jgi:hypothetical protein